MTTETANSRINKYWEKFALWACSGVIALLCLAYQDQRTQVTKLEEKVNFLYLDKVSKSDLKETEDRLMKRIEGMGSDILARLDIYFGKMNKKPD